jgi:hypothetical protein
VTWVNWFIKFSAIFANFRHKIGVFIKNQCSETKFAKNENYFEQNPPLFWRKYFKITTSVPENDIQTSEKDLTLVLTIQK